MSAETVPASFRPSAFYWRRAIRATRSPKELSDMALALVTELEVHKAYIWELGYIPPKSTVHPDEMREKGWGGSGDEEPGPFDML
ncbi:MAG: hypothetical protein WC661_11875 [Opitutaceae bacterium]|jgi:hypothetical protein